MNKHYPSVSAKFFYTLLFLIATKLLTAQTITTLAGGSIGDGKPATAMALVSVNGVAADANDNIYILDNTTNRIRKVTAATGIIDTYAGNGTRIYSGDGGPANTAGLRAALCIALDQTGNLYIADLSRIRKINASTGIINTIAGSSVSAYGGDNGPAASATLRQPGSITVDGAGNIYFTDFERIRKITAATGIITTVAGGTGTAGYSGDGGLAVNAHLSNSPTGITTDGAGNVYFIDGNNAAIRKIDAATGIITTVAGNGISGTGGDGGPATAAQLLNTTTVGLVADAAGNLYFGDNFNIRMVDAATGIINTIAGTGPHGYIGDGGNALLAGLDFPRSLAINNNNLYCFDSPHVIRKIALATNIIGTVCGNYANGTSGIPGPISGVQLYQWQSLTVDKQNNVYFADRYNNKIYKLDAVTDTITTVAGTGAQGINDGNGGLAINANLNTPMVVTVDTTGNIFFVENGNEIRKVSAGTGIITAIVDTAAITGYSGDGGAAINATIRNPNGLAVDAAGNLYIADTYNNTIRKVTAATGIITTIAGTGTAGYTGDGGLATVATLRQPYGVTIDQAGNIYFTEDGNLVVRRIDAVTGIITTVGGNGIPGFSGDGGAATSAKLNVPYGITTDTAGNIYFADQFNQRVRRINITTGIITTVAGNGSSTYNGDNIPATTAGVSNPIGICFDRDGNLLITDLNGRIRKVTFDSASPARQAVATIPSAIATAITSKVFPNPAHEYAVISINGAINGKTTILLTDLDGKVLISQQKLIQQRGTFTTTLPLQQLSKGIYFVTVNINNTKQVHKLVIQ